MRPAKCRQKVIKSFFVGQVDNCQARTPFESVCVKDVVVSHGNVEPIARLDARRIMVIIFGARRWDLNEFRGVLRSSAESGRTDRGSGSGKYASAGKAGLELLAWSEVGNIHNATVPFGPLLQLPPAQGMGPATRQLSYRQLKPIQGPF